MSVFQQRGVMRILRFAVAVAFLLLLLVSFSRGEELAQALNQGTETQSSLQDSSDHLNQTNPMQKGEGHGSHMNDAHSEGIHDDSAHPSDCMLQNSVHDGAGHSDMEPSKIEHGKMKPDVTDDAGHSIHIDVKNREGSVLPPNDGSIPDRSGHVYPTPAPDSE